MNCSRVLFLLLVLSVVFMSTMAAPAKSSRRKKGKAKKAKKKLPPPPTTPRPSRGPPEVLTDLIATPDAFEQLLEGVVCIYLRKEKIMLTWFKMILLVNMSLGVYYISNYSR